MEEEIRASSQLRKSVSPLELKHKDIEKLSIFVAGTGKILSIYFPRRRLFSFLFCKASYFDIDFRAMEDEIRASLQLRKSVSPWS
jgi:hypothetical protein